MENTKTRYSRSFYDGGRVYCTHRDFQHQQKQICVWARSASLPGVFFYFERLAPPGVCAPTREHLGASGVWLGVFRASEVRPSVLRAPGSGGALGVRLAWLVLPEVGGGFFRASGIFLWGSVTHSFRLDFHQQKEIGERPGRRAILHAAPALSPVLRLHSAPLRPRAPLVLSRDSPRYAGALLCSPPRPHTPADPPGVIQRSLPSLRMPDPWETRSFLRIWPTGNGSGCGKHPR